MKVRDREITKELESRKSGSGVAVFCTDLKLFLTPRARKMIFSVLIIFILGSLLIYVFPTPAPDNPREGKGDNSIILHVFELGGIAALVFSILHARRFWNRNEILIFFASCFLYSLLFEDMNIEISGDYAYNGDAWLVFHNTMLAIVFGWCAIAYCVVSTLEKSPVIRNWNPVEKGIVAGFLALSIDLGIDATAFAYGLWHWREGYFFGVPVTNFVGWFGAVFWFVFSTEYLRDKGNEKGWGVKKQLKIRLMAVFLDYGGLLFMIGPAFAFLSLLGMK